MQFKFPIVVACCVTTLSPAAVFADVDFTQTNLVSDLSGQAAHLDTNLVNPWGIAIAPNHPVWIADNGSGLSTIYNGAGNTLPLVVAIAPPNGGTESSSTAPPHSVATAFCSQLRTAPSRRGTAAP